MHTECKKPSWHRFEPCKLKKETFFLSLFFHFFHFFYFHSMVGAHVLNIIINIFFQPYNYGQLSGNSAFGQVALKWFSNT